MPGAAHSVPRLHGSPLRRSPLPGMPPPSLKSETLVVLEDTAPTPLAPGLGWEPPLWAPQPTSFVDARHQTQGTWHRPPLQAKSSAAGAGSPQVTCPQGWSPWTEQRLPGDRFHGETSPSSSSGVAPNDEPSCDRYWVSGQAPRWPSGQLGFWNGSGLARPPPPPDMAIGSLGPLPTTPSPRRRTRPRKLTARPASWISPAKSPII